jgi:hypothetical protein
MKGTKSIKFGYKMMRRAPTVNQGVSGSSPEGGALVYKALHTHVALFLFSAIL